MATGIAAAGIVAQLRKRFGIRGTTELALEESILPVANLGDLDGPPWNAKRGFIGSFTQAGVAAQFAHVGVQWPTTAHPGSALVIRALLISPAVAEVIRIMLEPSGFSALTTGGAAPTSWDSGDPSIVAADLPVCQALVASGSNAAEQLSPSENTLEFAVGATAFFLPLTFCLRRGARLVVAGRTVNTTLTVAFYGDEYSAE